MTLRYNDSKKTLRSEILNPTIDEKISSEDFSYINSNTICTMRGPDYIWIDWPNEYEFTFNQGN
ncbi:hypothetical protein GCM10008968_20890 [Bacillus horti]